MVTVVEQAIGDVSKPEEGKNPHALAVAVGEILREFRQRLQPLSMRRQHA